MGLASFLFEVGVLKRVVRTGWWLAGVRHPESVAEHTFRTGVIALVLGHLEGVDANKAAAMALVHDIHETRLCDPHRLQKHYLPSREAERKVWKDLEKAAGPELGPIVHQLVAEYAEKKSPEAQVVNDADRIEMLLQALEYRNCGTANVDPWIASATKELLTKSGSALAEEVQQADPLAWTGFLDKRPSWEQ